jgi:hypothetical protein
MNVSSRSSSAYSLLGAIALGLLAAVACGNGTGDVRVGMTCEAYCEHAHDCNDNVDTDACIDDCRDTIDDCMADEQEQALDDLDHCSAESCNDLAACTVGAGLQCAFGV